jgi:uncharacterized protein with GYD domain
VFFVTLARMRGAVDEEFSKKTSQFLAKPPVGIKIHQVLYTLGRYDIVILYEAPSEKEAMAAGLMFSDKAATETLVGVTLEEARKLTKR